MTRMINLSNYFLTIMCTIRNFTTLSPLFASVTAHLTKQPSVSPHEVPHEAVNRLHDITYMAKYKEAIKYVFLKYVGIFCLGMVAPFDGGMIILIQRVNFKINIVMNGP